MQNEEEIQNEEYKAQNKRLKTQNVKLLKIFRYFFYTFSIFFIYFSFSIFDWPVIGHVEAHSQNPVSGKSQSKGPFPPRQVEKNIAVDFYYKPLPEDEDGYERELSNFLASVTTTSRTDQNGQQETEGEKQKAGTVIRNQEAVYVKQDVALTFKITDATMNWPIKGLIPDCPIRFVPGAGNLDSTRRQILKRALIFGGHFPITEYTYLFVLNSLDGTVSVMDTASFWTGIPVKIIALSEERKCKGMDIDMEWLGRYIYVTLDTDEVAVIDGVLLRVIRRIKVGSRPHHVFVQPDGKYAWVCNDGDDTVSVIDTDTQGLVKTIPIGSGHHEIAFTTDSRYGCVTNQDDNSVTIIDVYTLSPTGVVPVGSKPHGLGYSSMSQYMYVANEGDGTVSVVDFISKKVTRTITVGKGVRKVRFGPDRKYGFTPNKDEDTCSIIDVTRDVVVETIKTGKAPEDITFTPDWVFIQNTGSANMTAMSLERMDMIANIPIGYRKPNEVELPMGHVSVVPQGDGHSVLVPSPAGSAVYRYAPGEAAGGTVPATIYNTQANGSSDLVVYYRGLKEVSHGVFTRTVRFGRPGRYEIGFYVDNPELTAVFEINVLRPEK